MNTLKTMTAAMLLGSIPFAAQAGDTFIGRTQPAISQRQFTPELLWAMGRIGHHEASPDGRTVVYNVSYYSCL